MAGTLGLGLTAEGVDTEEQRAYLQAHGVDKAQGYLFHRPMPAEALTALLAQENTLPAS